MFITCFSNFIDNKYWKIYLISTHSNQNRGMYLQEKIG